MSPKQDYKDNNESTNDLFLRFVKKEQEKKSKDTKEKSVNSNKKVKTFSKVTIIYNYLNQILDRILSNKMNILILSLGMACMLFYTISGDEILTSPTSGTKISEVEVQIENLSDDYELFGIPDTITVGLIGPSLDIYKTNFSRDYEIFMDLSSVDDEGEYSIELQHRGFPETLDVMLLPNNVSIRAAKKIERRFDLETMFINEDKLDSKYSVSVDSMELESVLVNASELTLSKIDKVVACIDVSNQNQAFEQEARIKAYDINGNIIKTDISPLVVNVKCSVASYSKSVAITPRFTGDVANGYAIANCKLNYDTVTIYGLEENINPISTIYADINVEGLKENTIISGVPLKKETGINKFSVASVEANISVEELITKNIENIPITVLNNTNKYKVSFAGEGSTAHIKVTGLENKIKELSADNIQVSVDIDGLDVGTHKVKVTIASDDENLKLELLSSDLITINIERN